MCVCAQYHRVASPRELNKPKKLERSEKTNTKIQENGMCKSVYISACVCACVSVYDYHIAASIKTLARLVCMCVCAHACAYICGRVCAVMVRQEYGYFEGVILMCVCL